MKPLQFQGTLEQFQELVARVGCAGHWVHGGPFVMFVVEDGESNLRLNWWPDSGALLLVGDPAQRQGLGEKLAAAIAER